MTASIVKPLRERAASVPESALLRKFDRPGPRYTSYPPADRFLEGFGPMEYADRLRRRESDGVHASPKAGLSLYIHVPFCESVCYYCACNKIVTRRHDRVAGYLDALEKEVQLVSTELQGTRHIEQIHLGGGTPTFLNPREMERLVVVLRRHFNWTVETEMGLEVDPRTVDPSEIGQYRGLGFNRISIGVQDFDETVQRAINRLQSFETTGAIVGAARDHGYRSVNLDLIYGLPHQNRQTFKSTIDRVLDLCPDRIALYHYAHLPERFKPQRRIAAIDLPNSEEKMEIMLDAVERLGEAGYSYIGMDHFALPTDELARAQQEGRLHRNFQGYSTQPECDLIGFGVSAIGRVGRCYVQNHRDLNDYIASLERCELPVARGIALTEDDVIRRTVIMSLMCEFLVEKSVFRDSFGIDFDSYFRSDLQGLQDLLADGLIELHPDQIRVTPQGRFLVRAIAMRFDAGLQQNRSPQRYSKIA